MFMKNLVILCILTTFLFSCGKDDKCSRDQFVGNWSGSETCTLVNATNVQISVTNASASDKVVVDGGAFIDAVLTINDCSLSGNNTVLGTGETYTGSLSADGTTLNLSIKTTAFGAEINNCSYELTK